MFYKLLFFHSYVLGKSVPMTWVLPQSTVTNSLFCSVWVGSEFRISGSQTCGISEPAGRLLVDFILLILQVPFSYFTKKVLTIFFFWRKKKHSLGNLFQDVFLISSFSYRESIVSKFMWTKSVLLTPTPWVAKCHRKPHELGIPRIVPHKKFLPRKDLFGGPVVHAAMVLEHHHVLFLFVSSATNKAHPTGVCFVFAVEVVADLSIMEYLNAKKKKFYLLRIIVCSIHGFKLLQKSDGWCQRVFPRVDNSSRQIIFDESFVLDEANGIFPLNSLGRFFFNLNEFFFSSSLGQQ